MTIILTKKDLKDRVIVSLPNDFEGWCNLTPYDFKGLTEEVVKETESIIFYIDSYNHVILKGSNPLKINFNYD